MNILLIGPAWFGHITSHVEDALRRLGDSVDVFFYRPPENPGTPAWRILKTIAGRAGVRVDGWNTAWQQAETRRLVRWHDRRLTEWVEGRRYDLILVLKGDTVAASTLNRIRRGAHLALWLFDDPFIEWVNPPRLLSEVMRAFDSYDDIFLFDSYYIPLVKPRTCARVRHLPLAYNERVFHPLPDADARTYPISFVGSGHPERINFLNHFRGSDLHLWGPVSSAGSGRTHSPMVTPDETNRIYNRSQVNLNFHARQSVHGANMRVFEVLGAGGFLLTDWKSDLAADFEEGTHLATYRTPEEAVERAAYYLEHEDERLDIRNRASSPICNHTYRHRLRTLLDMCAADGSGR